ncbi:MAG: gas vesicle protein [Planctomycetota bacterium]
MPSDPTPSHRGNKRLNLRRKTVAHAGPPAKHTPEQVTLSETLDRVLHRGIVARAEVVLSVADIPLVYVGLQALVSSIETAAQLAREHAPATRTETAPPAIVSENQEL